MSIILPVLVIGTIISIILPAYLSPNLYSIIRSRNEALLENAVQKGVRICEERFNDLLELRMASNVEMQTASLNQALEEIKAIHQTATDIHMLVISKNDGVLVSTQSISAGLAGELIENHGHPHDLHEVTIGPESFYMAHRYFPFWKIHIYGFIASVDHNAPIVLAKRIVYLGTFGVLLTVLVVLILLFNRQVNRPLKTLIKATQSVPTGKPQKITSTRLDEIGKLSQAFNAMVDNLLEDKAQIRDMMRELRDSEEQYRILSEYSLTHIAMLQRGRLKFINQTMAKAAGLDGKALPLDPFVDMIDPRDRTMVNDRLAELESGVRKTNHFECRLKPHDGDAIWLNVLATLALYRETHAVLFHAVDITQRKKLEKKLAQVQKLEAIGTLAGGVAHDLNNILSSLLGYPDLLLLDLPQDSPLRDPLTQIQHSAQRAAEIVQDLLTLARRGVDVKQVLSLNHIIQSYLQSLEHSKIAALHPGISFETDLDEFLLNLEGSSIHLTKTIMNLVRNAAESISDGGRVLIKTGNCYIESDVDEDEGFSEGDYVVLTVEDNGAGISREDIDHIFEPFYTKKVMGHSGTGLGMSVVLGTVEDHMGKVNVSSKENEGTTFSLFFPATREASTINVCKIPIEDYSGNGEKILVVDDVEEQRILMNEMLGRFGYAVQTVESGEAAVSFVRKDQVDLIVLDMVMDPGMDGLDTLAQVLEVVPDQKAIILSGYSETERVEAALKIGAIAYLKKPVVMEKLGITVRNALCDSLPTSESVSVQPK